MASHSASVESSKSFKFISEYCTSSTLHGVKYIGEPSRPYWERIFWLCVLSLSIYGSVKLTVQVWDKWQNHPVIISFSDKTTMISTIPFPAVTICPTDQVKFSTFNVTDYLKPVLINSSYSQEEWENIEAVGNLCELKDLNNIFERNNVSSEKLIPVMGRIKPSLEDFFFKCIWRGKNRSCRSLWTESVTSHGICYTFNGLGSENLLRDEMLHDDFVTELVNKRITWDSDVGYIPQKRKSSRYPRRVLSAGFDIGLSLDLLGRSEDFNKYCESILPGFLLFLHAPNDYPDGERNFIRISFDQEILIAIKPSMKTTSSKLMNYSPLKRQCYFSRERHLRFFKIYTQNNCEMECLGNYSLSLCKCLPFYIPRPAHYPVCRLKDLNCFKDALEQMLLDESEDSQCKCYPGCTALSYTMEVSYSNIYKSKKESDYMQNNTQWDLRADAILFFKEDQFWMSRRSETYGMTEFFANCGGVLGLLMGFSVLSLNELFYFLTFRLFRFIKSNKNK